MSYRNLKKIIFFFIIQSLHTYKFHNYSFVYNKLFNKIEHNEPEIKK